MIPNIWNKDTYKDYINYLISIKEIKYKDFSNKLTTSKYPMLGIRLPILRNIAKDISKTNIIDFLELNTDTYFEEVMIYGFVIQYLDEENFYKYFKIFIDKIDNWSICDSCCMSFKKHIKKNKNKYFKEIKKLVKSKKEYYVRVSLVLLLNNYVEEEYLDDIKDILNNINTDKYYINMAASWLVCELMIKYPEYTKELLKSKTFTKDIQNKAISKIRDSFRVKKEDKDKVNTYKM